MSTRKATASEIQAVGAILQDKEGIELLKKIGKEIVTEEDTKGKRQQNDIFQFIGFAHQDDILGEDSEAKEFQEKKGVINRLVDKGLILEGFHIPLERKSEKKFGDVRVSDTENKISKFKLTEEGLTVLSLVDQPATAAPAGAKQQQETKQSSATVSAAAAAPPRQQQQQQQNNNNKSKAIAAFKEDIKEENKL